MIFSFNANDPGIISQGYIQLPAPLITETAGDPDAPQFYVDYNSTQRNANRLAVWTGDEVIAWGLIRGNYDSVIGDYNNFLGGARYNPTYDNWTSMSSEGGPDLVADFQPEDPLFDNDVMPRALWTGNKMIIEGAGTNGSWLAYIYDPSTDSWSRPSTSGAPIIEFIAPESVWTGSKLIVWGVNSINDVAVLTGSVYDPSADSWSPMPNQSVDGFTGEDFFWMNLFITWAGSEMVLGGVEDGFENVLVTYSFDPQANEWSVIDRVNDVPFLELDEQEPIWTGSELIVGGVSNEFESETNVDAWEGYSFNPISRSWSKISSINAPIYGAGNLNVDENTQTFWTGSKMIVGATVANTENDEFTWVGYSYDPSTKSWTQLASTTLPKPTWYNGDQDNAYDFTLVGDQLCASPSTSRGFGVPSGNQDFKVYNIESNSWRVIEGSYTSVEQYSIIVKINALTNPAMLFLGSQQSSMFDPDTDGELAWRLVVSKYYGQKAFYLYSKP
jgi:N-acetylneuraminic acid mutarotase